MDLTHMSKFLVQDRDAEKTLNRICADNVAVPVGRIVYTQWLNERGTIEADMTVTRLAEDVTLLIVVDKAHTHVETWLKKHIPPAAHHFITDVTSGFNIINVQGPKSRQLMLGLTGADMSNHAFPYLSAQEIDIGYALVKALRVTYVGELRWELYVPTEFTLHVFDRLVKAGGFIGKSALLRQMEKGTPEYRLVQFLLQDPEPLLYGGESIFRDGKRVGYLASGGYGHTLGGAVGLGSTKGKTGVTVEFVMIVLDISSCHAQLEKLPVYGGLIELLPRP